MGLGPRGASPSGWGRFRNRRFGRFFMVKTSGPVGPKPNTRDTTRKVVTCISQKGRKAKRNQQKPPFEPRIGLGFTAISSRRTEERNRRSAAISMQVPYDQEVQLLRGS